MQIEAKITGIEYHCKLIPKLSENDFDHFDINTLPSYSIVGDGNFTFGLSKWVSPKRTRSYPYERVYNTLGNSRKITVIPLIKDEGKCGDRDFIQWDTISMMSLLDVFVIFSYYSDAEKHPNKENKIRNQRFDNDLVKDKILEIKNYHSSALHWNLKEIEKTFPVLLQKAILSYRNLSQSLHVEFHAETGIEKFAKQFQFGIKNFMETSRRKAKEAQKREIQTIQPKESLSSLTKATITIENYLGGKYYFTTDEAHIEDKTIFLIEAKHSKTSLLPSLGDIKDGLLKMILYNNLSSVLINGKEYKAQPVLKLTSIKLKGSINLNDNVKLQRFFDKNNFSYRQMDTIKTLILEAHKNGFIVKIEYAE